MKVCEGSESQDEEDGGAGRVLTYRIHDLPDQSPSRLKCKRMLNGRMRLKMTLLTQSSDNNKAFKRQSQLKRRLEANISIGGGHCIYIVVNIFYLSL
ncbi:hypothetical protein DVH24_031131 [Malus domestica]|uniref:Uncharacterized protein n=1 Tax=Malus domestica TaxID=3750 RepID=A0A498HBG7_MALDO|nr:hypothetical protein DVH24_031131 [Malus domestica]